MASTGRGLGGAGTAGNGHARKRALRGRGLRCRKFTGKEERGGAGPGALGVACVGRSLIAEVWSDADRAELVRSMRSASGFPLTPALQCAAFFERQQVAIQGPLAFR